MSKQSPTTLTFLQKDTIARAILELTNLGCKFAVVDPEGNRFGDLVVVKQGNGTRTRRFKFSHTGYIERVNALKPGQSELFEAASLEEAEPFRSSIASRAALAFGPGNTRTHVEGTLIEVLRIA